jgi:hypothetical protein
VVCPQAAAVVEDIADWQPSRLASGSATPLWPVVLNQRHRGKFHSVTTSSRIIRRRLSEFNGLRSSARASNDLRNMHPGVFRLTLAEGISQGSRLFRAPAQAKWRRRPRARFFTA